MQGDPFPSKESRNIAIIGQPVRGGKGFAATIGGISLPMICF
jgi:hypothetical protein